MINEEQQKQLIKQVLEHHSIQYEEGSDLEQLKDILMQKIESGDIDESLEIETSLTVEVPVHMTPDSLVFGGFNHMNKMLTREVADDGFEATITEVEDAEINEIWDF